MASDTTYPYNPLYGPKLGDQKLPGTDESVKDYGVDLVKDKIADTVKDNVITPSAINQAYQKGFGSFYGQKAIPAVASGRSAYALSRGYNSWTGTFSTDSGNLARSAANDTFDSSLTEVGGRIGGQALRNVGGIGVGIGINLVTGNATDESMGTTVVSGAVGALAIAVVPGLGEAFLGGVLVAGAISWGNSALYKHSATVRKVEDGIGHGVMAVFGGEASQKGAEKYSKVGRLAISKGDKYHSGFGHSGAIKMLKDDVITLSSTISSSTEDFCSAMKKINNNISKDLSDVIEDVKNDIGNNLWQLYPHLTSSDLAEVMSNYSAEDMYEESDVTTANKAIDKLGTALAKVSGDLKGVANGMVELDQTQARNIYTGNLYGVQGNKNY